MKRLDGWLALAAVLVPLGAWHTSPAYVGFTYGPEHRVFELFGLTAGALIAWVSLREGLARREQGVAAWLPVVAMACVAFHTLSWVTENSARSWDYGCYQTAAQALVAGRSPYGDCYLYPPLTARVLALAFGGMSGLGFPEERAWVAVFYLFSAAQVALAVAAFALADRFARRVGMEPVASALTVAALLTVANPVLRLFKHSQINLWVLDAILVALLAVPDRPVVAGLALAFGIHVKLFPALVAGVWGLSGERRLFAVTLVATALGALPDLSLWREYVAGLPRFPTGTYFRDNSLDSLCANLFRLAGEDAVRWPVALLKVALCAWFARRFWKRADRRGQGVDAIALALMLAPMTWEHHFVLAIPVALYALATRPGALVIAGAVLTFALPTFDVVLLGHLRLVGLLMMLAATEPR